jgi:hypothetical protein
MQVRVNGHPPPHSSLVRTGLRRSILADRAVEIEPQAAMTVHMGSPVNIWGTIDGRKGSDDSCHWLPLY